MDGIDDCWIDRVDRLLRGGVLNREKISAARGVDVRFHELVADDVAMVERTGR